MQIKYRHIDFRMKRRRGEQNKIFLTNTSQPCNGNTIPGDKDQGNNDGMVRVSEYGFAHVWEIQKLRAGGGSDSMIDSKDTLSTRTGYSDSTYQPYSDRTVCSHVHSPVVTGLTCPHEHQLYGPATCHMTPADITTAVPLYHEFDPDAQEVPPC